MMAGQVAHSYARCQSCAKLTWQQLHLPVAQTHRIFSVADLTDITAKLVIERTCTSMQLVRQESIDLPFDIA